RVNTSLSDSNVFSLAINQLGHVFAGTKSGVFRSTNSGDSWQKMATGLPDTSVRALGVNRDGHVFAGTDDGFYRSTDNGESWQQSNAGLTSLRIRTLAINSENAVFVGTTGTGRGVFRSTDNGDNWVFRSIGLPTSTISSLVINNSDHLFAAIGNESNGVFRSTNNGDVWASVNTGLANGFIQSLAVDDKGHLYAGTTGSGVFRSLDPTTAVAQQNGEAPESFVLHQNYPNPFNPSTIISYQIAAASEVELAIYNTSGRRIKTLLNVRQTPGIYKMTWDGKTESGAKAASGVYLYRLKTEQFVVMKKMLLIR
ncbi:MAG: FlgD immunoglobulin-like domain containing protein, partial [bacterium]